MELKQESDGKGDTETKILLIVPYGIETNVSGRMLNMYLLF